MKKNVNDKNQVNTILEKELVNMIRRGVSLDFISMEHRTRTVCLEAIIRYPYEIKYVPTKAPFYMELAELASRLNGDVISCIEKGRYTDRIIKNAIDSDQRNITYVVNSGIDHDKLHNIMIGIVTKDPCLFDYLPTTENDDDIIDLGYINFDFPIRFVFCLKRNIDLNDIVLQKEEVESVSYMSNNEIKKIIEKGLMHKAHAKVLERVLEYKNHINI